MPERSPQPTLTTVNIGARAQGRLATFYAELLRWSIVEQEPDGRPCCLWLDA